VRAAVDVDPAAAPARADGGKVKQVLMNLVLNAVQAMPGGGELRVRVRSGGADLVEMEVEDSGPGVPAAELDRVFEPFYTSKPGGAGLGLSVSRRIAEEHGGRLYCEPGGAGRGASFRLELPAWRE
jgi:signal transduction histidine kinase